MYIHTQHTHLVLYMYRRGGTVGLSTPTPPPAASGRLGVLIPAAKNISRKTHVVSAALPHARQSVCHGSSDANFKWMTRVTVGVARSRTLTAQWP